MCEQLFPKKTRLEQRPKKHYEHSYHYLQNSARTEAKDIRLLLESAFSNYPATEQCSLKKRILSKDMAQYKPAIFELLLHETLLQLGYTIIVHPALENSLKTPDFLVMDGETGAFYLEATLASEEGKKQQSLRHNQNKLFDELNVEFQDINDAVLIIPLIKQSKQTPRIRNLRSSINKYLQRLRHGEKQSVKWVWENQDGWRIELQLWKRSKKPMRFVGSIGPATAKKVDVPKTVHSAFTEKSTKYGHLNHPYVLAINVDVAHMDQTGEMEALFGQETFYFTDIGVEYGGRKRNGAWHGPDGPKNTRVSGVWLFDNLTEWRLNKRHVLYLNPYAPKPLEERLYKNFPHAKAIAERMQWTDGSTLSQILQLDWDWLI